ncbi:ATP-binding cassette sub-family F member 3 [Durusdinium trenchii]|uniref:ATP-binding cassette sub-family F member 3 n=1 Tax=Durusdinium trenchii TaxID=1381693 RepID=A0ABP0HJZ1_9DINO
MTCRLPGAVPMGRKPDPKKKEAKAASKKKNGYADKGENQRMSAESIGFQIRTGPEAPSKTGASMDIDVNEIVVFAGKQELLFNATLRLAQGIKYGLIGRNGVGKSTLLRAMDIKEHTFHAGEAWPNEDKKDVMFYAFQDQVKGTEPVYDFWNSKDKEHTFHFGEPWPNEEKGKHPVFYAYPLGDDMRGMLKPVHSFWNNSEKKHAFHLGDSRAGEDKHEALFLAFQEPLIWNMDALCDGAPAVNRAKWLIENKGMTEEQAKAQVMAEFPALFRGGAGGYSGGYVPRAAARFVDGKFPHTLEIVKDAKGQNRLKFSVTPRNPGEVTMIAVHYSVNKDPGHEDMNFDIHRPMEGSNTYVHVTPDFGPVCEPGSKVTYWLAAMEKGLIVEMPEKACRVPIPQHFMIMHVEQEIKGDDTPVLQSVLQADREREWLLKVEQELLEREDDGSGLEPKVSGVGLMEVYERLEELGNEDAEARAAVILAGLGFSGEEPGGGQVERPKSWESFGLEEGRSGS